MEKFDRGCTAVSRSSIPTQVNTYSIWGGGGGGGGGEGGPKTKNTHIYIYGGGGGGAVLLSE